ncbi:MAG: hypothetical protein BWY41_00108 [Candidatus Atribacteria bacterium ADurb.Bin276]|uniref:Uncharacterized protein n=1 Tax=Candidatus Atribacter allofermentans TaxID=1852833 RepID=A0A1V5T3X7_9BACT|nr:MAG: hypothetical protein BWY41_00108 [Candidatus Atribacteria bacterium ADurb.Bin276]
MTLGPILKKGGGGGMGDVTGASNIGGGTFENFKQKNGTILEFKTFENGTNGLEISELADVFTFDLQQDLKDTASPTFNGLTLSTFAPGSVLFAENAGVISQDPLFIWDFTNHALGIGVSVPTAPLDVAYTSVTTNTVVSMGRFNRLTSGIPGVGIGVGVEFQCQTSGIFDPVIGNIDFVSTDLTAGSEDFDFILRQIRNGSMVDNLKITSRGEILPRNIHNNGGTGNASNQAIASGTYTPTLFNVTNVAASTVGNWTWSRVGNSVEFSGRLTIDPTAASIKTELGFSLPIASTFTLFTQAGGVANSLESAGLCGGIRADIVNNRGHLEYINTADTANRVWSIKGQYEVR